MSIDHTSALVGAMLFATLYGIASGITAVTRATLPPQVFPAGAYARALAQLAVPLNLSFAIAPPAFAAILTSGGPTPPSGWPSPSRSLPSVPFQPVPAAPA